jgi:methyl-accepting chemotaxis protein
LWEGREDNLAERIRKHSKALRALISSTESDFLSIGAGLGAISSQARRTSEVASSVAGLVVGEEVTNGTKRLHAVFDLVDEYSHASHTRLQGSTKNLQTILGMMAAVHTPLSAFKKIVKHLHVLGVSTKIESARFTNNDRSFDVLAENVEKLSVVIASRSDAIFRGMASLNGAIENTLSRIAAFKDSKHGRMERMSDSLAVNLSVLSKKRLLSSEVARRLAAQSKDVSGSISDVVSLLQVHDIARQQIEHVVETFDEITREPRNDNVKDDNVSDILRDIGEVQIGQLTHAKNELVSAIHQAIEELSGIAHHVSTISKETITLASAESENGSSFLFELNQSISSVIASFERNREADKELSQAVASVTDTIGALSRLVNDIEDIGSEIELIALNARVKAAAAAEDGAALGVLAEAIKDLSDDARSQTLSVTDTLKEIGDVARRFTEDNHGDGIEKNPEEIARNLEGLHDFLDTSHKSLLALLSDLTRESGQLTGAIETIVNNITAHTRTDELINSVVSDLKEFVACSRTLAPRGEVNKGSEYLKNMASRYTMHQERNVHQSSVHPGVAIAVSLKKNISDGLGDNVELF